MYICRIKIQPYEDTVLYLSNLYCFAYFIGIDYPHGNRHYRRFSRGRSSLLGILSRKNILQLPSLKTVSKKQDLLSPELPLSILPYFQDLALPVLN